MNGSLVPEVRQSAPFLMVKANYSDPGGLQDLTTLYPVVFSPLGRAVTLEDGDADNSSDLLGTVKPTDLNSYFFYKVGTV